MDDLKYDEGACALSEQIKRAYRLMAKEARYRPCAPSDGFGNITVPQHQLNLENEARAYVARWWKQEQNQSYIIGCPDFDARVAMILAIEAAKACCGGADCNELVLRLLELSRKEMLRVIRSTAARQ